MVNSDQFLTHCCYLHKTKIYSKERFMSTVIFVIMRIQNIVTTSEDNLSVSYKAKAPPM